jgi:DNA-binding NarL/FixJ family response regulator
VTGPLVAIHDEELRQRVVAALGDPPAFDAGDGEAAIDHLWQATPSVIILDLELPRLSAYDVVRHLSMRRPELLPRVVVLTPEGDQIAPLLEELDLRHRVPKPFAVAALIDLVRAIATGEP